MGGQDGFSRDLLNYNEESNSILAGIKIHPGEKWDLGFDVGYTTAEGGLDPFDLPADDYVAITRRCRTTSEHPHLLDIDIERINFDAMLRYSFSDNLWFRLWYKLVDFDDKDPYLYRHHRPVQWATITAGMSF